MVLLTIVCHIWTSSSYLNGIEPLGRLLINGCSSNALCSLNACWKLPTRPLSEWLRAVVSVQQPRFACTFNVSCTPHHRCIVTPFTARTEEKDRQNAGKGTLAVTYAKSIAMPFPRH